MGAQPVQLITQMIGLACLQATGDHCISSNLRGADKGLQFFPAQGAQWLALRIHARQGEALLAKARQPMHQAVAVLGCRHVLGAQRGPYCRVAAQHSRLGITSGQRPGLGLGLDSPVPVS